MFMYLHTLSQLSWFGFCQNIVIENYSRLHITKFVWLYQLLTSCKNLSGNSLKLNKNILLELEYFSFYCILEFLLLDCLKCCSSRCVSWRRKCCSLDQLSIWIKSCMKCCQNVFMYVNGIKNNLLICEETTEV